MIPRRMLAELTIALLGAGAGFAGLYGVMHRAVATSGASGGPPAFVVDAAHREALQNSDARPEKALWVLSTRRAAINLDDKNSVDSNQPVYLVVMRGRFVDTKSFAPYGAPDPVGNQIEITIDAQSRSVLDFGLLNRPGLPDLARLGSVHDITAQVQGGTPAP